MIISCPKCSATYKVPDDKIPPGGAKFQCNRCQHSFRIENAEAPAVETVEPELHESSTAGFDDMAAADSGTSAAVDSAELGSASDLFGEPEEHSEAKIEDSPSQNADEHSLQDEISDLFDQDDAAGRIAGSPDFDWDDEADTEDAAFTSIAEGLNFAPGLSFSKGSEDFVSSTRQTDKPTVRRSMGMPAHIRRRISFSVFLLLLVAVGLFIAQNPDRVFNYPWQQTKQQIYVMLGWSEAEPEVQEAAPSVAAAASKFYEMSTMHGERILVVEGNIRNIAEEVISVVQVTTDILGENGDLITTTTVYAGNTLNKIQLKTFGMDKINEKLQREFGQNLVNFNIAQGRVVPFTAVFYPVPDAYKDIKVRAFLQKK